MPFVNVDLRRCVRDKPFRDRILMSRGDRHVVLASITWGIQIEVTAERVIQVIVGLITRHTGA